MMLNSKWMKQVVDAVDVTVGNFTFGKAPVFPFEAYQEYLKKSFNISSLELSLKKADYCPGDQILKFAGINPLIISLELAPIKSPFFIAFTKEEIQLINSFFMGESSHHSFFENDLEKGFFKFYLLKALAAFKHISTYPGLSLRLSDEQLVQQESYIVEMGIKSQNKESIIRLIFPVEFQKLFASHFEKMKIPLLDRINFSSLNLLLQLTIGSFTITQPQLKNLKVGDLVLLDHCSYQVKHKKGYCKISYGHTPLFQVKLKEDQIKILDYISIEENNYMDETDEEMFFDNEGVDESTEIGEEPKEELIDPNKIDLTILVEIGQIEMNLEKILELKPGSTIPLSKRPEEGVFLTLNKKKIAKGELIQLGEMIGVKILETL